MRLFYIYAAVVGFLGLIALCFGIVAGLDEQAEKREMLAKEIARTTAMQKRAEIKEAANLKKETAEYVAKGEADRKASEARQRADEAQTRAHEAAEKLAERRRQEAVSQEKLLAADAELRRRQAELERQKALAEERDQNNLRAEQKEASRLLAAQNQQLAKDRQKRIANPVVASIKTGTQWVSGIGNSFFLRKLSGENISTSFGVDSVGAEMMRIAWFDREEKTDTLQSRAVAAKAGLSESKKLSGQVEAVFKIIDERAIFVEISSPSIRLRFPASIAPSESIRLYGWHAAFGEMK